MNISTIIAIIGGIVTAGCAIAGAIAGIRARKAQEARNEEMRKAEHEARLQRIREANNARYLQNTQAYPPTQMYHQQPVNNEVHYYYHAIPQQQNYPNYYQPQNSYMNHGYVNNVGYSYGNQYDEPVYRGEREIGNMSKMQMLQRLYPQQNSFWESGYYAQPQYAYAS